MIKTISPFVWVCERCKAQFRSESKDLSVALLQVASVFKRHKCPLSDSPSVLRVSETQLKTN